MEDKNKISVVLTVPEFERFDAYCVAKGYKKSTLIARLIRDHMDHERFRLQEVRTGRGHAVRASHTRHAARASRKAL